MWARPRSQSRDASSAALRRRFANSIMRRASQMCNNVQVREMPLCLFRERSVLYGIIRLAVWLRTSKAEGCVSIGDEPVHLRRFKVTLIFDCDISTTQAFWSRFVRNGHSTYLMKLDKKLLFSLTNSEIIAEILVKYHCYYQIRPNSWLMEVPF